MTTPRQPPGRKVTWQAHTPQGTQPGANLENLSGCASGEDEDRACPTRSERRLSRQPRRIRAAGGGGAELEEPRAEPGRFPTGPCGRRRCGRRRRYHEGARYHPRLQLELQRRVLSAPGLRDAGWERGPPRSRGRLAPHLRSACDAPPPAGAAGAGTGRGVRLGGTWKNHPDCIAVGEAARRSRFPGAASPRGVRGARFPGAWICLGREVPPGGDAGLGYVVAHARQVERSRRLRGGPTPGGRRWLRKWLQPLGKSCVAGPLWPLMWLPKRSHFLLPGQI
ncbi:uncharacterized protein LOC116574950 [Mustela erminea]|uniref:uncharacterized protein LOC116574950 n=1 Tax=Mustela erminea TaxID=36723 RepID=UPI0013874162|nr:uncharacterized protein LOC116574950 [Mustela erminea]